MIDYIIFHDKCSDGKMSAAIMFNYLAEHSENEVKVLPYNYSDPAPILDRSTDNVYVVDFSFHGEALEHVSKNCNKVIIIDHHKGALEKMEATAPLLNNVEIHFNSNKSGAHLTWEYCFGDENVPDVVLDVSDRDLWQFKRPNSKATHLGLSGYKYLEVAQSDFFTKEGYQNLVENRGRPRLEFSEHMNRTSAKIVGTTHLLGRDLYVVNCHMQQCSDVGHLIIDDEHAEYPLVMVYMINSDTSVKLSFRSNDGSARAFANHFGGGGHSDAAGAEVSFDTFASILKGEYQE